MARVRAANLLGSAEGLLSNPERLLRPHPLGEPGDEIVAAEDDGTVVGRLIDVSEVPLAHLDVDPDERERLCTEIEDRRTVFVHEVATRGDRPASD
jgi:hypothetical protein